MVNFREDMKEIAIAAAQKAADTIMDRFGNIRQIASKDVAYKELVTDVDLQAEKEIIAIISRECPDHNILSEEQGYLHKESEYKWIVDPIDGTHNYARKMSMFGVSIALAHREEVILGVIILPYFDELYVAEKGKGAYMNGEELHVSDVDLSEALMIYDTKLRVDKDPMIKTLDKLVHEVFLIRMYGCATWDLCQIAKGQADLDVDFTGKPWDLAAGALIVEEAGGKVTSLEGDSWNANSYGYIASNGKVHEEVLRIMGNA